MVDQLQADQIDILFVIGGDGSMRGAMGIAAALRRREIPIGVIGIPEDHRQRHSLHRPELRLRHRVQFGGEDDQCRHGRGPIRHRRGRHGQADGPQLRVHRLLRRPGQPRSGFRAHSRGAVRAGRAGRLPGHVASAGQGAGERGRGGGRRGRAGDHGRGVRYRRVRQRPAGRHRTASEGRDHRVLRRPGQPAQPEVHRPRLPDPVRPGRRPRLGLLRPAGSGRRTRRHGRAYGHGGRPAAQPVHPRPDRPRGLRVQSGRVRTATCG